MKILLKIAYLGTAYCGYQVQPNGVTVQEKLNEAARSIFGFDCDIVGCSRTDSGVHARGFCATVTRRGTDELTTAIPIENIPRAMNAVLPADISVLCAEWRNADFHARYDVISKEYEYLFYNGSARDPFLLDRAWQLKKPLADQAIDAMRRAAAAFVGEHDFSALRDGGFDTDEKDATRRVFSTCVEKKGELICFRVRANGFLYHMVRIMAGTLYAVACGSILPEEIGGRLAAGARGGFGVTAPACGLYLDRVYY